MNTDKLHEVCSVIVEDHKSVNIPAYLKALIDSLNLLDKQRTEAAAQAVKSTLTKFKETVNSSRSANLSINQQGIVDHSQLTNYVGKGLVSHVESIITDNALLIQSAVQLLSQFVGEYNQKITHLATLQKILGSLGMESSPLVDSGNQVVAVFPSSLSGPTSEDLHRHIGNLNKLIKATQSAIDEELSSPIVLSLSSSDWTLYLSAGLAVLYTLSYCFDKVTNARHKAVEIRKARRVLEKMDSEDPLATTLKERENQIVADAIDSIARLVAGAREGGGQDQTNTMALKAGLEWYSNGLPKGLRLDIQLGSEEEASQKVVQLGKQLKDPLFKGIRGDREIPEAVFNSLGSRIADSEQLREETQVDVPRITSSAQRGEEDTDQEDGS